VQGRWGNRCTRQGDPERASGEPEYAAVGEVHASLQGQRAVPAAVVWETGLGVDFGPE